MSSFALWLLGDAHVSTPPAPSASTVVYIIAAAIAGGLIPTAYQIWKGRKDEGEKRRVAPITDAQIISSAVSEAAEAARSMLEEYRQQLEEMRTEVARLRGALQRSNERIAKLEGALESSNDDRERLRADLIEAMERRRSAERRLASAEQRLGELELQVAAALDVEQTVVTERRTSTTRKPTDKP